MFILYVANKLLTKQEKATWSLHEGYIKYGIKPREAREESEEDADLAESEPEEEVRPRNKRWLVKKSDPDRTDPDSRPGPEPRSATGFNPGSSAVERRSLQPSNRRYERLSPYTVQNLQGIQTHLGNVETKLGIMENVMRKLVFMTESTRTL